MSRETKIFGVRRSKEDKSMIVISKFSQKLWEKARSIKASKSSWKKAFAGF